MCQMSSRWIVILLTCFACGGVRADDVALFLEDRGFDRLLVLHLEEQLDGLSGEDRSDAARRLARLYAQQLMLATDPVDRSYLEGRGLELLEGMPEDEVDDLRVELINGRYLIVEDIAERHRLRLEELGETQRAIEMLDEILEELHRIRERTLELQQDSGRVISPMAPLRSTSRRSRMLRREQLLRRVDYLLGWSYYYRAWLSDDVLSAERAEEFFASLLELEPGSLSPQYVSRDLRSRELVAWSILGMAASRGMTQTAESSVSQWFDLLEDRNVPESIREILPGWRLAVLLDNGRYEMASELLDSLASVRVAVPTSWWRLAAVHALDGDDSAWSRRLAGRAIAELASRNALNHLYDLVERYGDVLSDRTGFALSYARGVLLYQEAQLLADGAGEAQVTRVAAAWEEAARQLEAAMSEPDAERWGTARVACGALLGWCLYLEGRIEAARDRFLWVLEQPDPDHHEEALWMAIVCQDRLVRLGDDESLARALQQLMDAYLARFPEGGRSGELIVRRTDLQQPSFEIVDALLRVDEQDPAWDRAQQQAARMLYRLYSEASGEEQLQGGSRYLAVAVPLLMDDLVLGRSDAVAAGRAIARSRRVLQVALDDRLLRLVAASAVLDECLPIDLAIELPGGFVEELTFRRMQLALRQNRLRDAELAADLLLETDSDGLWTRRAVRELFRRSLADWKEAATVADRREESRRLVRFGRLILGDHPTIAEAFAQSGMIAVASTVAAAELDIWTVGGDPESARQAWLLYGDLLTVHPRNQSFLRGRGLLAASQDERVEGVRCWRLLVSGTASGSDSWFEARVNLLELLEELDPEHARSVLQQHLVLFPDWGPEPWGSRLRATQRRLDGVSP